MASKNKIEIILSAVDQGLSSVFGKANKAMAVATENAGKYGKAMSAVQAPMRALTSTAAQLGVALGGAFSATGYLKVADEYTNIDAKLKLVTTSGEELVTVQKELYDMSQKTGTGYAQNALVYTKMATALKSAGASSEELLGINEAVAKSLVVAGSSAAEASSFLLQFGQAMGSGVLQGDEFRAIMESNSYFAQQLAKALDTDVAGLRKLSKQGQLTTAVIRDAVPKMLEQINTDFAKMPLTIGRAMTMLSNAFGKLVNGSNNASGATGKIAQGIKDLVTYIETHGKDIEDWIVKVIALLGDAAKFAWDNKNLILTIFGGAMAISFLATLTTTIQGLNTALLVLSGGGVIAWFKGLAGVGRMVVAGLELIPGAVTAIVLALAGLAGWEIGTLLNKFDVVRQAGVALAAGLTKAWLNAKLAWASLTGGDTAAIEREIAEADLLYGEMFAEIQNGAKETSGVQIAEQKKVTASAKTETKELTAFAKENEANRKKYQGEALEAMKKKYQAYAAEVRRLQDEIKNRELSLYDQLRNLARTGMSGVDAWKDLKRQAEEYEAKARAAAKAGDFKTAAEAADKARELYSQLNTEVKDGETVLISQQEALETAMDGVKRAGELGISALQELQNKAVKGMDDLVKESGFQDLTKGMDEAEKHWLDNWETMRAEALKEIAKVEDSIVAMVEKDRTVYINVKEVVQKATGGLIQKFARGGKLAGYGGGDRISALLEAGEFVIRKEAVSRFGAGLFHQLNNLRMPEIPRFATGGMVGAGAGSGETININMTLPGGGAPVAVQADRLNAAELLRQISRMKRLAA